MKRFNLKIAGQSGAGLLSTGDIVINALQEMGYYVVADREYPSLIKGGHACFTINFSEERIYSLHENVDVMVAIDWQGLENFVEFLKDDGALVYGLDRELSVKDILESASKRGIKMVHKRAREVVLELGGNVLMVNIFLLGMLWKTLGFPLDAIEKEVKRRFASKPKLLEIDLKCLYAGYDAVEKTLDVKQPSSSTNTIVVDGNKAIALGAVHGGVRAYFAYPMSPASSILTHLASWAGKTGMLVKQVEDEISVAQMVLGASHMGTRSFTATSGGGYDLMTETTSLAGMIETPFVIVDVQRPGPATGLPTWTGQGDFNLAVHSSHGEFPRIVVAVANPEDAFHLFQETFNLAEKYQCVALVLSDKSIAETKMTIPPYEEGRIPIERGLVPEKELSNLKNEDRYEITTSGLSKRWLPGQTDAYYFANSDEHLEDGSLTEDGEKAPAMYAKRMRKLVLIKEALPDPKIYGSPTNADISFVGWGSSLNVMLDIIEEYKDKGISVNYIHYSYVFPLKEAKLKEFFNDNKNVHLIEGNYTGQFGAFAESEAKIEFAGKFLKWNGRPFYAEDLHLYIDKNLKKNE